MGHKEEFKFFPCKMRNVYFKSGQIKCNLYSFQVNLKTLSHVKLSLAVELSIMKIERFKRFLAYLQGKYLFVTLYVTLKQ